MDDGHGHLTREIRCRSSNTPWTPPLGRWRVAEWRPVPGDVLDGVVECAWHFEGDTTLPRERVFPDGRVEVVVQLDEPHALADGTDVTRFPSVCVSGLRMAPMVIEAPPRGSRVLAVRLHPTGAHALLGMPLAETCGRTLALGDVLGRAAGELAQRCLAARSDVERLRIAVRWVAERVTHARGADPAVAWIAAEIARTGRCRSVRCGNGAGSRQPGWSRPSARRWAPRRSASRGSYASVARSTSCTRADAR